MLRDPVITIVYQITFHFLLFESPVYGLDAPVRAEKIGQRFRMLGRPRCCSAEIPGRSPGSGYVLGVFRFTLLESLLQLSDSLGLLP